MSQEQKGRSDLLQIWHLGAWHRAGLWELLPLNLYQARQILLCPVRGWEQLMEGQAEGRRRHLPPNLMPQPARGLLGRIRGSAQLPWEAEEDRSSMPAKL